MRVMRAMFVLALLATVASACGTSETADTGAAKTAMPAATTPSSVPAPSGKPILHISGKITRTNSATGLAFDMPTLASLATRDESVFEPFDKKQQSFHGVYLDELLDLAGVDTAATTVHIHALDDYEVDLKIDDLRGARVMLATTKAGAEQPIDAGGPIRVVFPDGNTIGKNRDLWIWSVDTMEVR